MTTNQRRKSAKKQKGIQVQFIGKNAESVTGSMTLIQFNDRKILLEAGLSQSNVIEKDYKVNNRPFKEFKPKDIDTIFLMHAHIDHIGLLPKLYKLGCSAKVFVPEGSTPFMQELLNDSARIMGRDARYLTKKWKKPVEPIYTEEDVTKAISFFVEKPMEEMISLEGSIKFEFLPSQHIINGSQLNLSIKNNNYIKKILYTSDLGNIELDPLFNGTFKAAKQANLVIAETTYACKDKTVTKQTLKEDLKLLEQAIRETCIDRKSRMVIPCFAMDRTQRMLYYLLSIIEKNKDLNGVKIYVDSPLAERISLLYAKKLSGKEKELFAKIMESKNVEFVQEQMDSEALAMSDSPGVVLSSSGMGNAGRVRNHLKGALPNPEALICFCGYACENTLAHQIKVNRTKKYIKIDNYHYANNCRVLELSSFSSHMQHDQMLKYYSDLNYDKIALVHGEKKNKQLFAEQLRSENKRKNKTGKVIPVTECMIINL